MDEDLPRPPSPLQPREDAPNGESRDDRARASPAGAELDGMDEDLPRPPSPLQPREDAPDEPRDDRAHASPAGAELDGMDEDLPRPPSPLQPREDAPDEEPRDDRARASPAGAQPDEVDEDVLATAGFVGPEQGGQGSAVPKASPESHLPSPSVKRRGEQPPVGSPPRRRQRTLDGGSESTVPQPSDDMPFFMNFDTSLAGLDNMMSDFGGLRGASEFADFDSMSVQSEWLNMAAPGIGPSAGYSGFPAMDLQGPSPETFQMPSIIGGGGFPLNSASFSSQNPPGIPPPAQGSALHTPHAAFFAPFNQIDLLVSYNGTVLREQNQPVCIKVFLLPVAATSNRGQTVSLLWLDQVILGLQQNASLIQALPTHQEWWKTDSALLPTPAAAREEDDEEEGDRVSVPAVSASDIELSLSLHLPNRSFTVQLGAIPPISTSIAYHPRVHAVIPTPAPGLPLHATLAAERRPIGEAWSIVLHILTTLPSVNKAFRCDGYLQAHLTPSPASNRGRWAPASCDAAGSLWPYLQTICDLVLTMKESTFWLLKDPSGQEVACISFGAVTWVSKSWFSHAPLSHQAVGCVEGHPLYSILLNAFPHQEPTQNHCGDQETAVWTHDFLRKRHRVDTGGRKVSKPVDKEFKADKMQRYRPVCNAEVQSRAPERLDLAELRAQEWDGLFVFSSPEGELDEKAFVEPKSSEQAKEVEELSQALSPILDAFLCKDPIARWCKRMPKEGQRDHVAICLWELHDMVAVCSFLYKLSLSWRTIPDLQRAIQPLTLPPYLVRRLEAGQTAVPMPLVVTKYFNTKAEQVRGAYKLFKMVRRADFLRQLKLFHRLRYPGEPSQNKWTPMFQLGWADSHLDMDGAVSLKVLNSQGINADLLCGTEDPSGEDQSAEPNAQGGARQHGQAAEASAASSAGQQQVQASARDKRFGWPASQPAGGSEARRVPASPRKADQAPPAGGSATDEGVRRVPPSRAKASTRKPSKAKGKQRAAVPDPGEDPKQAVVASSTPQGEQQDRLGYDSHPFAPGSYPAGAAAGLPPPGAYHPYLFGAYPYGFPPFIPTPRGLQLPSDGYDSADRRAAPFPHDLYSQSQNQAFLPEGYFPMHFPLPGGPQGVAHLQRTSGRAPGPYEPRRHARGLRSRSGSEQGYESQDEEDGRGPSRPNDHGALPPQAKVAGRARSGAPRLPRDPHRLAQELYPVQEAPSEEEYGDMAEDESGEEVDLGEGGSTTHRSGSPSWGRALQRGQGGPSRSGGGGGPRMQSVLGDEAEQGFAFSSSSRAGRSYATTSALRFEPLRQPSREGAGNMRKGA
ncbi:hypothetical protein EV715DRAFT_295472 [Schizophyllum commune]